MEAQQEPMKGKHICRPWKSAVHSLAFFRAPEEYALPSFFTLLYSKTSSPIQVPLSYHRSQGPAVGRLPSQLPLVSSLTIHPSITSIRESIFIPIIYFSAPTR